SYYVSVVFEDKGREDEVEKKREGQKSVLVSPNPDNGEGSWSKFHAGGDSETDDKKVRSELTVVSYNNIKSFVPHADVNNRVLQKLEDLPKTWDGKEMDVKKEKEKEKDSCRDRSEKETKITQRLLVKVRETSLMMCQEI
ncbi:hypothetical protein K435DRAFT_890124, partial [Dendrothele bispora CBS 962.96]